jgi:hypothetical protein
MPRNTASSVDQAVEWIKPWKSESRKILFILVSTNNGLLLVQFRGKVSEMLPLPLGSFAIQVSGEGGFAGMRLTGATVDPSLETIRPQDRQVIVSLRNSPEFSGGEAVELALPSGALLFMWSRRQLDAPSSIH